MPMISAYFRGDEASASCSSERWWETVFLVEVIHRVIVIGPDDGCTGPSVGFGRKPGRVRADMRCGSHARPVRRWSTDVITDGSTHIVAIEVMVTGALLGSIGTPPSPFFIPRANRPLGCKDGRSNRVPSPGGRNEEDGRIDGDGGRDRMSWESSR